MREGTVSKGDGNGCYGNLTGQLLSEMDERLFRTEMARYTRFVPRRKL